MDDDEKRKESIKLQEPSKVCNEEFLNFSILKELKMSNFVEKIINNIR